VRSPPGISRQVLARCGLRPEDATQDYDTNPCSQNRSTFGCDCGPVKLKING
jgi:hypothetical protein